MLIVLRLSSRYGNQEVIIIQRRVNDVATMFFQKGWFDASGNGMPAVQEKNLHCESARRAEDVNPQICFLQFNTILPGFANRRNRNQGTGVPRSPVVAQMVVFGMTAQVHLSLTHLVQKPKKLGCGGIVGHAEFIIELAVVGVAFAERFGVDIGVAKNSFEPLSLSEGIGIA